MKFSDTSKALTKDNLTTVDIVINNAGVMWIEEPTLLPERIELILAINRLAHFLPANLITAEVIAAAKA